MNNLKTIRKEKKKTQLQVASLLGVTQAAYSMYESGVREPDKDTLFKLADYFNVTTDYLLGRTDNPNAEITISVPPTSSIRPDIVIPDILQQVGVGFHEGAENLTQEDIDDMALALELSRKRRK